MTIPACICAPLLASAVPPSITFLQAGKQSTSSGAASSWTFTSQNLGTADGTRQIIVTTAMGGGSYVTGVTVGGISAVQVGNAHRVESNNCTASMWIADVPTGTTGSIVVTANNTANYGVMYAAYAAYNLTSSAPYASVVNNNAGASTNYTMSVNVPAAGIVVSCATNANLGAMSCTWAPLAENYDQSQSIGGNTQCHTGAAGTYAAAQTPLSVTPTFSTAQGLGCGLMASWK